ncbi:MAG: queuosine precursor transporter [Anaerolineales bacterium]|jgi:uncharacterized integral membrane protein (TIGR00697 family)|nr:queuosine precursor transporter [Anaerolineales bacterium]
MKQKTLSVIVIVATAYVAAQILADIASLRILFIAGFSIDAGTLVYPLTFTLRDLVHKTAGIITSRVLIITAAVINLFMAALFWVVSVLPADQAVGPQLQFGAVLSPVWRIVFASIIAEVVAEFTDGEVYQRWVDRAGDRWQWGRVLSSNAIAIPVDSLLFTTIAFGGVLPIAVVISIFWSNIIVKGATTIFSIPLIYLVPELPKHELDGDQQTSDN